MQVALEALSLSDCVASSEQTGVEMASIGNKGCNAEDAISSPVNILIGIVTLHGLGLSRLVKFFPLSPTKKRAIKTII
ncbi:hypothetical protein H5410_017477 [Solanum commersonii]|uniref:Uncharacterized protein n=1 Tax=Solanum commersonii TaxID=4109 RepID=A0A9J5ZZ91_SOLCO|nr:hypothetical protein H5410_017477 [Solanum commersonii]